MNRKRRLLLLGIWYILKQRRQRLKKNRARSVWVNEYLRRRDQRDGINLIVNGLRTNDRDYLYNLKTFLRFSTYNLDDIINRLTPVLTASYHQPREPIPIREKIIDRYICFINETFESFTHYVCSFFWIKFILYSIKLFLLISTKYIYFVTRLHMHVFIKQFNHACLSCSD